MTHAVDDERVGGEHQQAVLAAAFPAAPRVLRSRAALEDAILLQREQIEQIVHDLMNP